MCNSSDPVFRFFDYHSPFFSKEEVGKSIKKSITQDI